MTLHELYPFYDVDHPIGHRRIDPIQENDSLSAEQTLFVKLVILLTTCDTPLNRLQTRLMKLALSIFLLENAWLVYVVVLMSRNRKGN
jgi:hypothetical protein